MVKSFLHIAVVLQLAFAPIWPLGENPFPGDPFLIVNKQTNLAAIFLDGKIDTIVPVGTGKTPELTPEGLFTVTVKAKEPYYRKKDIPGGDLSNPLGSRWIGLDARNTDGRVYGIHGTNDPLSVGKYVSQGCIRMKNDTIEEVFEQIPLGTRVLIVSSSRSFHDLAKHEGALYPIIE